MNDKWGKRLFIAGAAVLVLAGAVHSLSFFVDPAPANALEKQMLGLMDNYKFNLMGSTCTMSGLMRGFSITFMVSILGLGALDLLLARERAGLVKRVALVNVLWMATMTAVSIHYFFAIPISFLASALLLFVAAWL